MFMPERQPYPTNHRLLTRDQFRENVFLRDCDQCVICKMPAQDAHHILERRLWPDGGYYMANGASLCGHHHIEAEQTRLDCDTIREAAGIDSVLLPPHLYKDQPYDKWGNPILPSGARLRGDLFQDPSVQKVLGEGGMLAVFTTWVKFPRTYHLPWSPNLTKDDRMMPDRDPFKGQHVVATVKMDGENTTMYRDYIHARALAYPPHPSRDRVKALWGRIAHEIPDGWRICGENLYAKHSIKYTHLDDFFLVFSVWNDQNQCLSWEETREYAELLGLKTVPEIYTGTGEKEVIENLPKTAFKDWPYFRGDQAEGYVVRLAKDFHYSTYRTSVGKYVRKGHVATHAHWMREIMVPNELAVDTNKKNG